MIDLRESVKITILTIFLYWGLSEIQIKELRIKNNSADSTECSEESFQIKELRIKNNSASSTECSEESFQLKVIFKVSVYESEPTSPVCCFQP